MENKYELLNNQKYDWDTLYQYIKNMPISEKLKNFEEKHYVYENPISNERIFLTRPKTPSTGLKYYYAPLQNFIITLERKSGKIQKPNHRTILIDLNEKTRQLSKNNIIELMKILDSFYTDHTDPLHTLQKFNNQKFPCKSIIHLNTLGILIQLLLIEQSTFNPKVTYWPTKPETYLQYHRYLLRDAHHRQ